MTEQLDTIFTTLGTGYWNWLHYVAVGIAVYLPSSHTLAGAFAAPRLKFWCLDPFAEEDVFRNHSSSDPCSNYKSSGKENPQGESCKEWGFDNSTFSSTATSEFELNCQMDYLRATYQSIYMIGVLVGSPFNGVLADRYGRKTTFVYGCLIFTVLAYLSCWLPNLPSVLTARFLLGTMHTALLKTGFIFSVEISSPKVRTLVGIVIFLPWALGTMAWGGLAYLIRDWRILLTVSSLPCIILLPFLWFLDESPRWLVVNGQHERALLVLKKAAKWNKATLPTDDHIKELMRKCSSPKKEINASSVQESEANKCGCAIILKNYVNEFWILFRTPRMRIASIVTHTLYLALGMVYFGLNLGGSIFSFDIFSYMALMGLVELPANTIMAPIVSRFGRRVPIATLFLTSGVSLLIQPFLPSVHQSLLITCTMIGKMTIAMAFQGCNLYATELFPTEVRTRGISSSFMMSRVGSAIAPFITEYLVFMYPWAPFVVFGSAAVISGFATLVVWETKGLALPDTIAHLERPDFQPKRRYSRKIAPAPDSDVMEITK